MIRRKARELGVQVLFQYDYNKEIDIPQTIESILEENDVHPKAIDYAKKIIMGTLAHVTEIDALLTSVSREWKVERMAGVDRNIARIATYEMKFSEEKLTPNIVINEAVEIAKTFGTDESARFINGLLGSLVKPKV